MIFWNLLYFFRRDILRHLGYDLKSELDYTTKVMVENPKNYQVWHHRRVIVEWLNDASEELNLTKTILRMDAKNYHAWQHRQWVIKEYKWVTHIHLFATRNFSQYWDFRNLYELAMNWRDSFNAYSLFDNELVYIEKLIASDVRNNSAWNQRFFVLKYMGLENDALCGEIHYVMNRIRIVKDNESSWNYLRGILQLEDGTLSQHPEVNDVTSQRIKHQITRKIIFAF